MITGIHQDSAEILRIAPLERVGFFTFSQHCTKRGNVAKFWKTGIKSGTAHNEADDNHKIENGKCYSDSPCGVKSDDGGCDCGIAPFP